MNEEEIGRLVARVMADVAPYLASMNQAQESAKKTADEVKKSADRIEAISSSVNRFGTSAAAALGAIGISTSLSDAFSSFSEAERGMIRMSSALKANGADVAAVTADYKAFAKSIAAETLMTSGSVMGLLTKTSVLGLEGDAAKNAVKMAIALAAANDTEASSQLHVAAMIQRGHLEHAKRALGLRDVKDQTELTTQATKRLAAGYETAREIAASTSGQIEKLKRAFGDLKKDLGGLVAEAIRPVVEWLTEAVRLFRSLDPEIRKVVVQVAGAVGAFMLLGPALSVLGVLFGPLIAALKVMAVVAGAILTPWGLLTAAVVGLGAAVIYWTGAGASMLEWFTRQWGNLKDEAQPAIDAIAKALQSGNLQLAAEIAFSQVKLSARRAFKDIEIAWYALDNVITVGAINFSNKALSVFTKIKRNVDVLLESDIDKRGEIILRADADLKSFEETRKKALRAAEVTGQNQIQKLMDDLKALEAQRDALVGRAAGDAVNNLNKQLPPVLPPSIKPIHLVAKFDAAAYGSAEAIGRFLAQANKAQAEMQGQQQGRGLGPLAQPAPAVIAVGADAWRRLEEGAAGGRAVGLLQDIRDDIRAGNKGPRLEIEAAGLA